MITRDHLRGAGDVHEVIELRAEEVREVCEGSAFAGMFQADASKAFLEFRICHSLPVVSGPTSRTGNLVANHPAAISRAHVGLRFQQTNLNHHLKAHGADQDRIVGAVVATSFPPEPAGGWVIPEREEDAIPITAVAVVFKKADGAMAMLKEHQAKGTWSVSIEIAARMDAVGIWVPSLRVMVPLLDADDDILAGIERDEDGSLLVRDHGRTGERMVLVYGGGPNVVDGVRLEGVGYTKTPAESAAWISAQHMSRGLSPVEAEEALWGALMREALPGSRVEQVWRSGTPRLLGASWSIKATEADPVLQVRLNGRGRILRRVSALLAAARATRSNFPSAGDDKEISLATSAHAEFDFEYARALRANFPSIWRLGGKRNLAFAFWSRARALAAAGKPAVGHTAEWIRQREGWAARHAASETLAGVLAQMRWGVTGKLGAAGMKELVERQKERFRKNK